MNESDTRAKLIDPALHVRGWTEDLIKREETAGAIEIVDDRARQQKYGRVDYTLRVKIPGEPQPRRRANRSKSRILPARPRTRTSKTIRRTKPTRTFF